MDLSIIARMPPNNLSQFSSFGNIQCALTIIRVSVTLFSYIYIYIHTYIHIYIHTYIYIHINIYIYISLDRKHQKDRLILRMQNSERQLITCI